MTVKQPPSLGEAIERILASGQAKVGAPVGAALAPGAKGRKVKPPLVEASFTPLPVPTWVIPLYVTAGDNQRGNKAKIGRAGHERRTVSKHLGGANLKWLAPFAECAARGETVTVTVTRLGPTLLDDDNATAALKYCRDTCALVLGFSDDAKSPLRFVAGQEKHERYGVRISLRCGE